jgi:hypothetical protein
VRASALQWGSLAPGDVGRHDRPFGWASRWWLLSMRFPCIPRWGSGCCPSLECPRQTHGPPTSSMPMARQRGLKQASTRRFDAHKWMLLAYRRSSDVLEPDCRRFPQRAEIASWPLSDWWGLFAGPACSCPSTICCCLCKQRAALERYVATTAPNIHRAVKEWRPMQRVSSVTTS